MKKEFDSGRSLRIRRFLLVWGFVGIFGSSTIAADSACEPSYPGVCIAPAPPDLDCRDVPHRNFRVRPPDPHRFDGDGDGIGCEVP